MYKSSSTYINTHGVAKSIKEDLNVKLKGKMCSIRMKMMVISPSGFPQAKPCNSSEHSQANVRIFKKGEEMKRQEENLSSNSHS